jgi:H-type lectin domain
MKTFTQKLIKAAFLFSIFFALFSAQAQAPQKMSYQAVVRNAANTLVANTAVGVKISVLQTTATGTTVYSERHTPTTNANGLASFEIGGGTVLSGTFATINWANGPYFIKTETDPVGGTNYTITGTSQLASVPYALFAGNAGTNNWTTAGTNISNNNTGNVGIGQATPTEKLHVNNGNIKIGEGTWSAGNDKLLKFGDASFVSIGEVGADDKMEIKANEVTIKTTGNVLIPTGNIGVGAVGSLQNKLQIGTAPGFSGNDIAIGNGTQAMSLAQSLTASTFFTNTNFAFMPASGPANVGIGTTTPTAKLDVRGSARVSENDTALGTVFKQIQAGNHLHGSSPVVSTISIVTFPHPFNTVPIIIATPIHQAGILVDDNFSITIISTTTTGFTYDVRRNNGSSWAQGLRINWIALSY